VSVLVEQVGTDAHLQAQAFERFLAGAVAEQRKWLAVMWFHTPHAPYQTTPEFRRPYESSAAAALGRAGEPQQEDDDDVEKGPFTEHEMDYFGDIRFDSQPHAYVRTCYAVAMSVQ
jgi:hypothetical protein